MELKRVVVTGLGALTPVGNNVTETWENLVNGVSGAGPVTTTLFNSIIDYKGRIYFALASM